MYIFVSLDVQKNIDDDDGYLPQFICRLIPLTIYVDKPSDHSYNILKIYVIHQYNILYILHIIHQYKILYISMGHSCC